MEGTTGKFTSQEAVRGRMMLRNKEIKVKNPSSFISPSKRKKEMRGCYLLLWLMNLATRKRTR
jgi:hypothetical protein